MRRIKLWGLGLMALGIAALSACGGGSTDGTAGGPAVVTDGGEVVSQIEITFWHAIAQQHEAALAAIIEDFEAAHPNITVEAISKGGYQDLSTALMTAMPTRNRPTIAQVYESWTSTYMEADVIIPVQQFIDADDSFGEDDLNDFFPGFLANNTWGDQIVTLPFNKSVYLLFVNDDMLAENGLEVPTNWEELRSVSLALTEGDRKGIGFRPFAESLTTLLFMNGGTVIDDNGVPQLDQPACVETLAYLNDLMWTDESTLIEANYLSSIFGNGAIGTFIGSSAGIPYVESSVADKFEWSTVPIPVNGDNQPGTLSQGTNVAILKPRDADAAQTEAAWEFLKYLTNSENTSRFAQISGYLPVRRSALQDPDYLAYLDENPHHRAAAAELENAVFEPRMPQWEGARSDIQRYIGQLFANPVDDVAAFAQRMNSDVQEALND